MPCAFGNFACLRNCLLTNTRTVIIGSLRFNDAPSTTTRPERIRSQTAHARGSTSSAVTLRRRQIILQRRVVESHRCSSTPAYVHLQPNHYRPRRQILNSLIKIKREYFILNLKMMQEASKRRCNKIKLLSLSFVSKLISQRILIKH